jgi:hypothetical protein
MERMAHTFTLETINKRYKCVHRPYRTLATDVHHNLGAGPIGSGADKSEGTIGDWGVV